MTLQALISQLAALREQLPSLALPLLDQVLSSDDDELRIELIHRIVDATRSDANLHARLVDLTEQWEGSAERDDLRLGLGARPIGPILPPSRWTVGSGRRRGERRATAVPPTGPPQDGPSAFAVAVASPSPSVVERTPHIDLSGRVPVPIGAHAEVTVYLDTQALREGEHGAVMLPALDELHITVSLSTSPHFRICGAATDEVIVRSDEERSTEAKFNIEYVAAGQGPGVLAATFGHNWRPAGSVWREVAVGGAAKGSVDLPTPTVAVDTAARAPDLVVAIKPALDGDERHFELTVSSRHLPELAAGIAVPWNLPLRTKDYVYGFMEAFTTSDPGGRRAALIGAGKDLFAATPEAFQQAFWALIGCGKTIESIFVVTSEPFIPWELMVPDDGMRTRQPLGVEFSVGRWVDRRHASPEQLLPITDGYVIAPNYRGDKKLASSSAEAQLVVDSFNAQRISPAYLKTIDATLAARGASLLHLICHGIDGDTGQILELDPDEKLYEIQLGGLDGVVRAVREARPLVFINACQVGRSGPTLVGTGGFASRFTRLGARCVIAPIWSVDDKAAGAVARTFYEHVKADPTVPFARVLRDIRKQAYEGEDPEDSYAAYCLYGDPLAAQAVADVRALVR